MAVTNKEPRHYSLTDTDNKEAVPYIPPPPPTQVQQSSRPPIVNTMIIMAVILTGGFMAYNYASHALTKTAGQSIGPATYQAPATQTVSPTPTPTPKNTPTP